MFNFGPFQAAKDAIRLRFQRRKKNRSRSNQRSDSNVREYEESIPSLQDHNFLTSSLNHNDYQQRNFTASWGGTQSSRDSSQILIYRRPGSRNQSQSSYVSTLSEISEGVPVEHDSYVNICNTFWKASLSCSVYKFGDALEDFGALWPQEDVLDVLLLEAYQATALRKCILDLCQIALRCGPVRVLRSLLQLQIISLTQKFTGGATLLHEACLAQNFEVVLFLCTAGINTSATDKSGRTADQVCFCPRVKNLLPQRYKKDRSQDVSLTRQMLSMHEKHSLFELADKPSSFYQLQYMLQSSKFDVNREADEEGNCLVHIASLKGISHIPLLLTLVRVQGADIDKLNSQGLSPLMMAVNKGDHTMTDVLLCVLGSNPSGVNPNNGWTALHYAVKNNDLDMTSTLLRRGADFNLENLIGQRPDDLSREYGARECGDLILTEREQRIKQLSHLARDGALELKHLRQSDLYLVDENADTLIMVTAKYNKYDSLNVLLQMPKAPVNAQNEKSGQTALTMAAIAGHPGIIHLLMRNNACPFICDMDKMLPLHWAVTKNNIEACEALLKYPRALVGLQQAIELSHTAEIQARIQEALVERQREIVTPELFECALTGDAGRLYCVLEDGDFINPISGVGDWPLYLAASNGHMEVVQLLHEHGGDIHLQHDTTRSTALHAACSGGYTEVVRFLLQKYTHDRYLETLQGAPPSGKPVDDIVNCVDGQGKTALQIAAEKGYSRIVKLLLSNGATTAILDVNGQLYNCSEYEGVQVLIESRRGQHMQDVMTAVCDKRGLAKLREIWLPCFDHNLRDANGDTPLMVACKLGRLAALKFLLESAVYNITSPYAREELQVEGYTSDADSGTVLSEPRASWGHPSHKVGSSIFSDSRRYARLQNGSLAAPSNQAVTMETIDVEAAAEAGETGISSRQPDLLGKMASPPPSEVAPSINHKMAALFNDFNHKCSIYMPDNKINHLCAMNVTDGRTAFHRVVEGGDQISLLLVLLDIDQSAVNMQDTAGLTPLHLACQLGRRKIINHLASLYYVDLNLRTLEGNLPEEMSTSRTIARIIHKAREQQPQCPTFPVLGSSIYSPCASSVGGSSINFDDLNTQFALLKQRYKAAKNQE